MQSTERLRPVALPPPASAWLVPIAAMVVAMIGFDVALLLVPELSYAVLAAFTRLTTQAASPSLALTLVRIGVTFGAILIGFAVMARFARGVQTAPFVWLAPVLVGFSSLVIGRMSLTLPLPISLEAYAVVSALMLLGGGALVQEKRALPTFTGTLLITLPVALLAIAYAARGGAGSGDAAATLGNEARVLFFVLSATTVGVALIALLTPAPAQLAHDAQRAREHEQRLAHAREQVRLSEGRAKLAERTALAAQASLLTQGRELEAALAMQDEAAVLTGRRRGLFVGVALAVISFGSVAALFAGYSLWHKPLQAKVEAQSVALAEQEAKLRDEHTRAQVSWSEERGRMAQELQSAQGELRAALASASEAKLALEASEAKLALAGTPAADEREATVAKAKTEANKKRPRARAKSRKLEVAAPKQAAKAAPSEPKARAESLAGGVESNDDPIAGLDGL